MITAAMMIPISAAPVQISASCRDESIAMNIKRPNRTIASALRSVISFMIPQKTKPKVSLLRLCGSGLLYIQSSFHAAGRYASIMVLNSLTTMRRRGVRS